MRPSPSGVKHETFVRLRERGGVLDRRPDRGEVERLELVEPGDRDRALRVADRDVLEAPRAPARLDLAGAVRRAARISRRAQRRAAHVDAARRLGEDRRPDLARDRLDRELARVGPARAAQVEDRLAGAVAAELGLRAVGVEDLQARDVAGLAGRVEHEHAVGADAGVAVAQGADRIGLQRRVQPGSLDDHVVVAQGLPLLEAHARRTLRGAQHRSEAPRRSPGARRRRTAERRSTRPSSTIRRA